jgi:hypothetical protein
MCKQQQYRTLATFTAQIQLGGLQTPVLAFGLLIVCCSSKVPAARIFSFQNVGQFLDPFWKNVHGKGAGGHSSATSKGLKNAIRTSSSSWDKSALSFARSARKQDDNNANEGAQAKHAETQTRAKTVRKRG